jgi:hypothetical protein
VNGCVACDQRVFEPPVHSQICGRGAGRMMTCHFFLEEERTTHHRSMNYYLLSTYLSNTLPYIIPYHLTKITLSAPLSEKDELDPLQTFLMKFSFGLSLFATTTTAGTLFLRASPTLASRNSLLVSRFGALQLLTVSTAASAFVTGGVDSSTNRTSTQQKMSLSSSTTRTVDAEYPGTAVERMMAVRARVATLSEHDLSGEWEEVRRKILWAGGLKDLPDSIPGQGYTGHSFNDYNHVDLTCMAERVSDNENDGSVKGIAIGNRLGPGIRIASLEELGPGGSWSTCAIGCNKNPPQDVAHIQFQSRIAFKLVWAPTPNFDAFVLVDDEGKELARGKPTGTLPSIRERMLNFEIMKGSKYSTAAEALASSISSTEAS